MLQSLLVPSLALHLVLVAASTGCPLLDLGVPQPVVQLLQLFFEQQRVTRCILFASVESCARFPVARVAPAASGHPGIVGHRALGKALDKLS